MDALECLLTRRSVPRLVDPAPDQAQLDVLLRAAAAAPDHGLLRPWRAVVVEGEARHGLGNAFADAHRRRDPRADDGALEKTAAKPLRAPMVVAVVAAPVAPGDPANPKDIPEWEQRATAAAVTQNLCLAAHALGWGSMWRTGWFAEDANVAAALGVRAHESVMGFVYLGTVPEGARLPERPAVDLSTLVSRL